MIKFPPRAAFPKLGPSSIPPWVWEKFLELVVYREYRAQQRETIETGTRFWHFLGHEIKRAELDLGLWIGRMKEMELENEETAA